MKLPKNIKLFSMDSVILLNRAKSKVISANPEAKITDEFVVIQALKSYLKK